MADNGPGSGGVRVTVASLRAMAAAGRAFAALTCYDATTARWLARAGVPVLLVGDTAAEMTLGFSRTLDMPLEVLLALTAGVKRGSQSASGSGGVVAAPLVMGDMPFMSYHCGADGAVRNAGRFLTEGLADVVKLEVDASFAPVVERMVRAGVPVCGHVGSRPQRSAITGYSAAGRTPAEADAVVADAGAMIEAGCVMLLVEAVPEAVAARVMALARPAGVPVIGIGAGPSCDGQVLVLQDWLGLTDRVPAFVPSGAAGESMGAALERAGRRWVELVAARGVGPSPYKERAGRAEG